MSLCDWLANIKSLIKSLTRFYSTISWTHFISTIDLIIDKIWTIDQIKEFWLDLAFGLVVGNVSWSSILKLQWTSPHFVENSSFDLRLWIKYSNRSKPLGNSIKTSIFLYFSSHQNFQTITPTPPKSILRHSWGRCSSKLLFTDTTHPISLFTSLNL